MNPHEARLSSPALYRRLRLEQLPSSRDLYLIRNATQLMKSRGEGLEGMEMLLMVSYPECSQQLLSTLLAVHGH